ncbi:hypothetical protein [Sphingomonas sp. dw_22]|uniref:hypothetical protein n=1 Tax=Sphingomonas sp. dw_22 TaxID=2721175 RepID=UPI001BD602E7|nr:hypothetical protein [Sphingomonas sp. dw_22]
MNAEIDTGRVAFALAQTTLSMLIAAGVLESEIVQAAADALEHDGALGLSEHEIITLTDVVRSSVPQQ